MEQVALTSGDDEKAKVQSVLLLTDGLANEGITGMANILNVIKKFQEEGQGAVETYSPVSNPPRRQQQQRVQNVRQTRPGFFGRLFGNQSSSAQPTPPPLQQPGPPPQQQQAPQMQQQAPLSMPKLDVNDEEEAMEVDESEPKPKPSGPKVSPCAIHTLWFKVRLITKPSQKKTVKVLKTESSQ